MAILQSIPGRSMSRQSNIELLRIIATLMIILLHFSGWLLSFVGVDSFWEGGSAMTVTRATLNSITCIGVVLFVLISGYFSIRPKVRSLLNLFTCLAFFYLGAYLLNCWITDDVVFQHHRVLRSLMASSRENWFIQCYLFLVLLAPVLNAFVEKVGEKALLAYILIFVSCAFYFGCVHDSTYFYFNRGYSISTFMLVYLIGRYIRLYGVARLQNVASWKIFVIWAGCTLLMCIGNVFLHEYAIFWCYCSPIHLLSAIAFFMLFTRIHFQSKIVNWIGVSCLAAYILHTLPPLMGWIIEIDEKLLLTNALLYFGGAIGVAITVFLGSVLLDKVRIFVCKPLINILASIMTKGEKS